MGEVTLASIVGINWGNTSRSEIGTHKFVPYTIFSFLSNMDSFNNCLNTAVPTQGDADTIGAIACSLSGAYLGINAIPDNWILKLENYEYIKALAEKLCDDKIN